ncbi:hypothetical protein [Streptomyces sp. NPDC058579]|uniref:hypothetical protein n=1 Tax=Streptomyces sp. NPDC058579 TaxID=3346548 RepID=UPI003652B625
MAPPSTATVPTEQDRVALAEIELCGELIIAASAADGERLSADRIDEVLRVDAKPVDAEPVVTQRAVAESVDTKPVDTERAERC